MEFDRRTFLHLSGGACLPWLVPGVEAWAFDDPQQKQLKVAPGLRERTLILVELQGGNDGLNTVIPLRDERYRELRPRIGLKKNQIIELDSKQGMHSSLKPLTEAWEAEEANWILGLGYPDPNRSHFRSIEIWETGSDSDEELQEGWLTRMLKAQPDPERAAEGIIIGGGDAGPLYGTGLRVINMDDPEKFSRQARAVPEVARGTDARKALEHLLDVQDDIKKAAGIIEEKIQASTTRWHLLVIHEKIFQIKRLQHL